MIDEGEFVLRARPGRRPAGRLLLVGLAVLLTACTSSTSGSVTVTSDVTATGGHGAATAGSTSGRSTGSGPGSTAGSTGGGSSRSTTSGSSTAGGPTSTSGGTTSPSALAVPLDTRTTGAGPVVKTEPDGLRITRLKAGEAPPQFVVFSFDGVGWDEKWQYWFGLSQQVPLHFTGFLSGVYLLSDQTRDKYTGPGHPQGKASIPFDTPADLHTEIGNLNKALAAGEEIGTHFVGHFCDDNPPGGNDWDTSDWNSELDQFFSFVGNVDADNGITDKLNLTGSEIKGERTPCLTGKKTDLYPALEAHGMTYDSSFTRPGLSWPVRSTDGKIWEVGMPEFPIAGSGHTQIMMDYNFWAQQENSKTASPEQSAKDSAQVLATYQAMLASVRGDGVHEPLILGNHFEDWNNNAYSDALAKFAQSACGKTGVYCVPFRDLIDWMQAQDPAVLAALQNHRSNFGGCPYTSFPHCDGKITY